jgi:hypothetical protein
LCHEILHLVEDESEGWEDGEGGMDEGFDVGAADDGDMPPEDGEDGWYMADDTEDEAHYMPQGGM